MTHRLTDLRSVLEAPKDAASLSVFRVLYGVMVAISAIRFFVYGWIDDLFVRPRFFFRYWGIDWLGSPSPMSLRIIFGALVVLGLAVAAGAFYRVAVVTLVVLFTYVQLLDVTNYLNHYYLVSLLGVLLAFMPLERAHSVDAWRRPSIARDWHPAWCTYLLRFQIGVVYFYAGLAKLSADWLVHAQPLNIWLSARTHFPVVGSLFDERAVAYAFSWAGFIYDTSVPLLLSWRRVRPFAYAIVLGFHAMTSALFPIGMFPVIMTAAALVFFDADWPRKLARHVRLGLQSSSLPVKSSGLAASSSVRPTGRGFRGALLLAGVYVTIQVLVPLRAHAYGGNVAWHEQGMRFSWRVMVREKNASVTYVLEDLSTGRTRLVRPREYLDARQEREFSTQPDLILQLAHRIASDERARGRQVRVRVQAIASLNGRPPAPLIDPDVDLATVRDGVARARWIMPAPDQAPPHLRPT